MPVLIKSSRFSEWQLKAIDHLKGGGIVWATPGEGKTRVAIEIFARLQKQYEEPITCLFIGRRAAFYDYTNEIRAIGYNNWLVDEYSPELPRFSRKVPTVWLVSHGQLNKYWPSLTWFPQIKFIIFDELYLFSNIKAARTKAGIKLVESIQATTVGLSGTIMPANDNATIWGQASTVRIQHLLARNLTQFRTKYQTCKLIEMGYRRVPITKNKPNSKRVILERLDKKIYLHFPKSSDRTILEKFSNIPQTAEQERIIKQLKLEYYADLDNGKSVDIKVAVELVIKIQQVANGWIKDSEGFVHSIKTNKIEALKQSVSELVAAQQQCVIWCAFKHDLAILQKEIKIPCLLLQGGKEFDIKRWKTGNYPVAIATVGSGASFNHFSQVAYAKYFSMSFKWLDFQQSRMRHSRKDSKHTKCHIEHFHVAGSLDYHAYHTATQSGKTENDFIKSGMLRSWLKT